MSAVSGGLAIKGGGGHGRSSYAVQVTHLYHVLLLFVFLSGHQTTLPPRSMGSTSSREEKQPRKERGSITAVPIRISPSRPPHPRWDTHTPELYVIASVLPSSRRNVLEVSKAHVVDIRIYYFWHCPTDADASPPDARPRISTHTTTTRV